MHLKVCSCCIHIWQTMSWAVSVASYWQQKVLRSARVCSGAVSKYRSSSCRAASAPSWDWQRSTGWLASRKMPSSHQCNACQVKYIENKVKNLLTRFESGGHGGKIFPTFSRAWWSSIVRSRRLFLILKVELISSHTALSSLHLGLMESSA